MFYGVNQTAELVRERTTDDCENAAEVYALVSPQLRGKCASSGCPTAPTTRSDHEPVPAIAQK